MRRGTLGPEDAGALYDTARLPAGANFARSRAFPSDAGALLNLDRLQPFAGAKALGEAPDLDVPPPLPPEKLPAAIPFRDELRYGRAQLIPISQAIASARILQSPQTNTRRVFLFVVNTHPTQILYMNFGDQASSVLGVPINPANGFIAFDVFIPQDDIYLAANGAATTGVLVYSNKGVNDYPTIAGG